MLNCFCLESCFLCLISMISDRLTTQYWKWSGVRFMRTPTKPCGVGKIDRQELEAGTSPSCGSPGVRLFWSFGWWWALEGDERSLVCCGDFLNSPRKFWISIRTPARRPYPDVFHPQSSLTGKKKRRMAPTTYQEPINFSARYCPRTIHRHLTTYSQINPWSSSREHWSKTSSSIYAPTWTKRQRFFQNFEVSNITFLWNSNNYMWTHFIRIMFFFP